MNKNVEIGSLIIRLVLGFTFLVHGFQKWQGGIENTVGFFDSLGIPGFMAYIVATIELVGGVLIILGLATRVVAALFVAVMLGAIFTAKLKSGFVGGFEFDIALIAMSAHLFVAGSQFLALDKVVFKKKETAFSLQEESSK
ncbi:MULTISPECIES: DoxX family protein [Priestia]|uniref:DoxX family oxidoreductase CatD n=2 Tax=Priestia TaxID=2800373 RepID=A0AAX6BDM4_PRIMG|nr:MULTISPECIES: DoxX family protein [Priestia]MBK0295016.1 DoxX family protein [Bacillus sp. S34]NHH93386.1 putative oxidoreductase CatD [Bacillus sp. MB95]UPK49764.1 DoxX family protein [Bacillus sp. H8-1]AWD65305.1 DoxX family protein [Priestia megaterium]MBY0214080.1 DoxX family protein [Priestia aryabhattai]